jgi:transcriptional regulator GlxA family with amidase domain
MVRARALLTQSAFNIAQIALKCGYDDPLYFSRIFQKTTGMSASAYRKYYSARQG